MVQVIENRAALRGLVESVAPHPTLQGYSTITVTPTEVADVAGFPNLFASNAPRSIVMHVQSDRIDQLGLAAGDEISAQIRLAGPQNVFADASSLAKA
jgi:hypothetical protein